MFNKGHHAVLLYHRSDDICSAFELSVIFFFCCGLYITFTVFAMFIIFLINIYGIMIISINLDYRKYGIG
jgi:hypothetical protein